MNKRTFYTEYAYVCGILALAFGTALMEKANLGISMIVAPAYLLYLKLSQIWTFVTFGMMEYMFQAVLLITMMIFLRRFRISYLFSFITAVLYGFALDGFMNFLTLFDASTLFVKILLFMLGMLLCAFGVAFMFRTYISPEVYELLVKEVSYAKNIDIHKFKTIYDCTSCIIAFAMSCAFFGFSHIEGVKIGTIISALINGKIIGICSKFMDDHLEFKDKIPAALRFFR